MGLEFGALPVRIRRVIYYRLSPYEQNPWKNTVSKGFPNMARRFLTALPIVAPGFITGIAIYVWATTTYERLQRKNPKDFENDE